MRFSSGKLLGTFGALGCRLEHTRDRKSKFSRTGLLEPALYKPDKPDLIAAGLLQRCTVAHASDTGVCEKNTPLDKKMGGEISFQKTKSGAGLQFLLLGCG